MQSYEKLFAQRQMEDFGEKRKKELSQKRRELEKSKRRISEIDGIIQKLYEDNATGKISDERFATMAISLEDEQRSLRASIPKMESELETAITQTEGLQKFIDKAKKVTQLTELAPEIVHGFIEKIVVGKPEYKDGKRYQSVEIHYNGVGIIREPSPEEMEEYFEEHIQKKLQEQQKRHSKPLHRLYTTIFDLRYKALGHLPYGGCPKSMLFSWWRQRGSNPRPHGCEPCALTS